MGELHLISSDYMYLISVSTCPSTTSTPISPSTLLIHRAPQRRLKMFLRMALREHRQNILDPVNRHCLLRSRPPPPSYLSRHPIIQLIAGSKISLFYTACLLSKTLKDHSDQSSKSTQNIFVTLPQSVSKIILCKIL